MQNVFKIIELIYWLKIIELSQSGNDFFKYCETNTIIFIVGFT